MKILSPLKVLGSGTPLKPAPFATELHQLDRCLPVFMKRAGLTAGEIGQDCWGVTTQGSGILFEGSRFMASPARTDVVILSDLPASLSLEYRALF